MDRDKLNIGQLADNQSAKLTPIEELIDDLANGREVYQYQIEQAVECVETAQGHAAEITKRYEEENGPIAPVESVGDSEGSVDG